MESKNIIPTAVAIISNDFELQHTDKLKELLTKEELRSILSAKIEYLLNHDFQKLLNILYRIDVDEQKAKELLRKHSPSQAPIILADLIIERQLQKIKTRQQFSKNNPSEFD